MALWEELALEKTMDMSLGRLRNEWMDEWMNEWMSEWRHVVSYKDNDVQSIMIPTFFVRFIWWWRRQVHWKCR